MLHQRGREVKIALLSMYRFEEVRGGTEIFIEHLRKAFPDLQVITYSSVERKRDLDLSRLSLEEAKKGFAISRRFLELHREEPFDLVIANSTAGWYLSMARPDIPMVNIYHFTLRGLASEVLRGTPGYFPSRYLASLFEKVTSLGKINVAVSPKVAREMWDLYRIRSRVIENGVPLDLFRPTPMEEAREAIGLRWNGPVALFVGRADHTKGVDILMKVARQRPDIRFLCVTSSPFENDCLEVRRNVPYQRMPLYYSAADLLLFPSRYESVGYTALEAMACDLPVVASRTGVFEDMTEGGIGRIVSSWDADDYLVAIDQVLGGPPLHPRSAVSARYSMERFVEDYRAMVKEAVTSYRIDRGGGAPSPLPRR
ncbi:MAG: glycosyltransferase family 4 protein [Euryarchaeota archaeon]|nr:glycosyltransferase family 4 protein [Euryarchaeota archaeon]